MTTQLPRGSWKQGNFVVAVPVALRRAVHVIRVTSAAAQILGKDPAAFYVVIPGSTVRGPGRASGAIANDRPVLPWDIPVQDRL